MPASAALPSPAGNTTPASPRPRDCRRRPTRRRRAEWLIASSRRRATAPRDPTASRSVGRRASRRSASLRSRAPAPRTTLGRAAAPAGAVACQSECHRRGRYAPTASTSVRGSFRSSSWPTQRHSASSSATLRSRRPRRARRPARDRAARSVVHHHQALREPEVDELSKLLALGVRGADGPVRSGDRAAHGSARAARSRGRGPSGRKWRPCVCHTDRWRRRSGAVRTAATSPCACRASHAAALLAMPGQLIAIDGSARKGFRAELSSRRSCRQPSKAASMSTMPSPPPPP